MHTSKTDSNNSCRCRQKMYKVKFKTEIALCTKSLQILFLPSLSITMATQYIRNGTIMKCKNLYLNTYPEQRIHKQTIWMLFPTTFLNFSYGFDLAHHRWFLVQFKNLTSWQFVRNTNVVSAETAPHDERTNIVDLSVPSKAKESVLSFWIRRDPALEDLKIMQRVKQYTFYCLTRFWSV